MCFGCLKFIEYYCQSLKNLNNSASCDARVKCSSASNCFSAIFNFTFIAILIYRPDPYTTRTLASPNISGIKLVDQAEQQFHTMLFVKERCTCSLFHLSIHVVLLEFLSRLGKNSEENLRKDRTY